jgi:hypothetical protein
LIGDSHVQQYGPRAEELARTAPGKANTIYFATQGSCPPIPGVRRRECRLRRAAHGGARMAPAVREIDTVVVGGCWNCYFTRGRTGLLLPGRERCGPPVPGRRRHRRSLDSLGQLLRELSSKGKKVYLLLDNPVTPDFEPKRLLQGSRLTSMKVSTSMPTLPIPQDQREFNDRLRQIAASRAARR